MAKLSRRGAENWRGRVNYYIAIDGTKFSVIDGNRRNHKQAKADAKAHSLKILGDQGLKFVGGKLIGSDGAAYDDYGNAVAGQQRYTQGQADLDVSRSEFDTKQSEFETLIKEGGATLEELAKTKAARRGGFMAQQMQNALLASGQDPTMIQSIAGRGQAATQRGLQDVLKGIQGQTTQQLAGAKQFGIGTDLGLEGIATERMGLQDAMTQFMQSQQLERDKIQASLDMQPEWWESGVSGIGQGAGKLGGAYMMAKILGIPFTGGASMALP